MYKNIQPFGGEDNFIRGRLRLVKRLFGCGYSLSGKHSSITERKNRLTIYAKTLVNYAKISREYTTGTEHGAIADNDV